MSSAPRLLAIPPPEGAIDPACVDAWIEAGALAVGLALLLRQPGAAPAELLADDGRLAPLRQRARAHGVPLLLGCDARALPQALAAQGARDLAGVQLRGDPDPALLADARAQIPRAWILGRSCHSDPTPEALAARHLVDYTCVAPVFPPSTAQRGVTKAAIGLRSLAAWCSDPAAPILALGGISPARAPACLDAGAHGLAAIGLFFGDPARARQDVGAVVTALQARDVQPLPPESRP